MQIATSEEMNTPFVTYIKHTARSFGLLLMAVVICLVFLGVGGALAPFVFFGVMTGQFPNIVPAVFSCIVTIPLLLLFPFHALYALGLVLTKRQPNYAVGIYGAAEWVQSNRFYDPTFDKKASSA